MASWSGIAVRYDDRLSKGLNETPDLIMIVTIPRITAHHYQIQQIKIEQIQIETSSLSSELYLDLHTYIDN